MGGAIQYKTKKIVRKEKLELEEQESNNVHTKEKTEDEYKTKKIIQEHKREITDNSSTTDQQTTQTKK